jgi:TRAP-type mannitol/chloroaromatic compound transport system permease small subunit
MARLLEQIAERIDTINEWIGRGVSLLTIVMVINVFIVVVMRYVFNSGEIWMQESYVWTHATVFMLGAGYTLLHDRHVRIDIIYAHVGVRYNAAVNILGTLLFAFPVLYLIWDKGSDLALRSWAVRESSAEVGGLPGLFVLKSVIPLFAILFAIQFISLLVRSFGILISGKQSGQADEELIVL